VLARREERVLSKALTFSAAGTKYCVKTNGPGTALRGAKVTLHHFLGGGMSVQYKDRVLDDRSSGPLTHRCNTASPSANGTRPVPPPPPATQAARRGHFYLGETGDISNLR
jgi:hypothetical protein